MSKIRDRITEPSTWAGVGLIVQAIFQLWASKGADNTAWASLAGGIGAVFLPEKTVIEP